MADEQTAGMLEAFTKMAQAMEALIASHAQTQRQLTALTETVEANTQTLNGLVDVMTGEEPEEDGGPNPMEEVLTLLRNINENVMTVRLNVETTSGLEERGA